MTSGFSSAYFRVVHRASMIKGMGSTSKILSPFSSAVGTMPLEMGAAWTLPPESAASRHCASHGKVRDVLVGIQSHVLDHHPRYFSGPAANLRYADDLAFQILGTSDVFGDGKNIRQDIFGRGDQDDVRSACDSGQRGNGVARHKLRVAGKKTLNRQPAPFHINKLGLDAVLLKRTSFFCHPQTGGFPR